MNDNHLGKYVPSTVIRCVHDHDKTCYDIKIRLDNIEGIITCIYDIDE